MKILLLEDDKILCDSLKEFLELDGYQVDTAHSGIDVFDLTYDKEYDLYILDINVPDTDGFNVLKALKEAGDDTPAIYITALTDIGSISKGFEIGAVDYIKKPFDPEELLIRIKSKYEKPYKEIAIGNIVYEPVERVIRKKGEVISLGDVQSKLFHELATKKNHIVSSYNLMEYMEHPSANALRVNLAKLKNKLGIDIKNIRGQGYMIEDL